jgi:hypothetical protein
MGLLAPTESLPLQGTMVPPRIPGAKTSLFSGPSGSHFGGTSCAIMLEVSPLPPNFRYASGTSSVLEVKDERLILNILAIGSSSKGVLLMNFPIHYRR